MKGLFSHHKPLLKATEFVILIIIFSLICIGAWAAVWGGTDTVSLKWLQLLQSIGLFLLPVLTAAFLWSDKPMDYLHLSTFPSGKSAFFAITIILVGIPAVNLMSYWNQQLTLPSFLSGLEALIKQQEENAAAILERFMQTYNIGGLIINILLMAALPAICEEGCFRGILQNLFSGNSVATDNKVSRAQHIAIWSAAFIFSFAHFQFYGFLPRLLLGALLGYLLVWTGSLWTPIIAHCTNNTCSVVLYYIMYNNGKSTDDINALGTGDTLWLGIASVTIVAIMIYLYCRKRLATEMNA